MENRIAVFPGTFDPVTKGHADIVNRAAGLFDKIIIAVGVNTQKKTLFSLEQRIEWLEETFKHLSHIEIKSYQGLTVDFCKSQKAKFILRGLRNSSDFNYETHIAHLNTSLDSEIETVFILTSPELSYISSTLIRDLIIHKGEYKKYLPEGIKL